jgi:hypothetical protein
LICTGALTLALSNQIPYIDSPISVNWQMMPQWSSMWPKDAAPLGDEASLHHRSISIAWIIIYAFTVANPDTMPPNV